MNMRLLHSALAILLLCLGAQASVRTWSSVGGAAVDAEFVEVSDGFVVLKQADDSLLRIHPANLSQADREYLSALIESPEDTDPDGKDQPLAPAAEWPPTAVVAGDHPAVAEPEDDNALDQLHIFDSKVFSEPMALLGENFPAFTASNPELAKYIGIQYGPRSEDMLYLAFDIEDDGGLPVRVAVHNLGRTGIRGGKYTVDARRSSMRAARNERIRVARFQLQPVSASFGDLEVETTIELVAGYTDATALHVVATTEIVLGRERYSFGLGGDMYSQLSSGAGKIAVKRLYAKPELAVRGRHRRVVGIIRMNDWLLLPGRGMDRGVRVSILGENERVLERNTVRLGNETFYQRRQQGFYPWFNPDRFKERGIYRISATVDLGPLFGELEATATHQVRR